MNIITAYFPLRSVFVALKIINEYIILGMNHIPCLQHKVPFQFISVILVYRHIYKKLALILDMPNAHSEINVGHFKFHFRAHSRLLTSHQLSYTIVILYYNEKYFSDDHFSLHGRRHTSCMDAPGCYECAAWTERKSALQGSGSGLVRTVGSCAP